MKAFYRVEYQSAFDEWDGWTARGSFAEAVADGIKMYADFGGKRALRLVRCVPGSKGGLPFAETETLCVYPKGFDETSVMP